MPLVQYNNAMHGEERKRGGGSGGRKQEYSNGSGDSRRRETAGGRSVSQSVQLVSLDSQTAQHARRHRLTIARASLVH